MRLIDVRSKKLVSFSFEDAPPYAILSHTWGTDREEPTMQDIEEGISHSQAKKSGWSKLDRCCRQAREDGLRYAWIDTCCIDKTNQVELSEAINSMFKWYQHAVVCYVYLSDVLSQDQLAGSRWFTRGWTLQELIAPSKLNFYASDWSFFGTRAELSYDLEEITSIPEEFLHGDGLFFKASIAQRMSWASDRTTKRKEDMAYCLLGIFDVSVPILYGDPHAFTKLQHAIMAKIRDDSILAWGLELTGTASAHQSTEAVSAGVFAAGPENFKNCGSIVSRGFQNTPSNKFSIESAFVHISLTIHTTEDGDIFGLLNCGPEDDGDKVVGIPLVPPESGSYFIRSGVHQPRLFSRLTVQYSESSTKAVYIKSEREQFAACQVDKSNWIGIRTIGTGLKITEAIPADRWEGTMVKTSNDIGIGVEERTWLRLTRNGPPGAYNDTDDHCGIVEHDEPDTDENFSKQSRFPISDFILVVDFVIPKDPSNPSVQCHLMIASPEVSVEELANPRHKPPLHIFGHPAASNGELHITASINFRLAGQRKLQSRKPRFIVSIVPIDAPPAVTVDITFEMTYMLLEVKLVKSLLAKTQLDKKRAQSTQRRIELSNELASQQRLLQDLQSRIQTAEHKNTQEEQEVGHLAKHTEELKRDMKEHGGRAQQHNQPQQWFPGVSRSLVSGDLKHLLVIFENIHQTEHDLVEMFLNFQSARKFCTTMQKPLEWAIAGGHYPLARRLLAERGEVGKTIGPGPPVLVLAARSEQDDITSELLKCQADLLESLLWAVESGESGTVSRLLKAARTPGNTQLEPVLVAAAADGHLSIIKLLLGPEKDIASSKQAVWAASKQKQEAAASLILSLDDGSLMGDRKSLLLKAVQNHDDLLFSLLLREGKVSPNETFEHGRSILWHAAGEGNLAAVRHLTIDAEENIDDPDSSGQTTLSRAAEKGHMAVIRQLLVQATPQLSNSRINLGDSYGLTPLWYAATNGYREIVEFFFESRVENNFDWNQTLLVYDMMWRAIDKNDLEMAQLLWNESGIVINPYFPLVYIPSHTYLSSLLYHAVKRGNRQAVELLLSHQPIKPDEPEISTLWAPVVESDHAEILKVLIEHTNYNVNTVFSVNDKNETLLRTAARRGAARVVELLLSHFEADANQRPYGEGDSALSLAVIGGHVEVVNLLIKKGNAITDLKSTEGQTSIELAILRKDIEIIRILKGCSE
ncbi:hypothetical protein QBC43DRAFT_303488 [Cladorrhinum sp. PSN259]|nr:hypothetical protein QBC43DRAFT_303488 [Cladorrhinum sp. PSN259]